MHSTGILSSRFGAHSMCLQPRRDKYGIALRSGTKYEQLNARQALLENGVDPLRFAGKRVGLVRYSIGALTRSQLSCGHTYSTILVPSRRVDLRASQIGTPDQPLPGNT